MKYLKKALIVVIVLLFGFGLYAQWGKSDTNQLPKYLLYSRPNGIFALVRLKDWSIKNIKGIRDVHGKPVAFSLAAMPGKPLIVVFGLQDYRNLNDVGFLAVLNLDTGKQTKITYPLSQTHMGQYIVGMWIRPGDLNHVYVIFSNKYSFEKQWEHPYQERGYIMASLEPDTMKWKKLSQPLNEDELLLPYYGDEGSTPLMDQYYLDLCKKESSNGHSLHKATPKWSPTMADLSTTLGLSKNDPLWKTETKLKEHVNHSLVESNVLKKVPDEYYRPVLYYGLHCQIVWRGDSFALVKTEGGKSTVVSESSKKKAKELEFLLGKVNRSELILANKNNSTDSREKKVEGVQGGQIFVLIYNDLKDF